MLLDLLGAPNPKFYDHFDDTSKWYSLLVDIESRLGASGGLVEHAHNSDTIKKRHQGMFQPYALYNMGIEDDHIPFLRRKVCIQSTFSISIEAFIYLQTVFFFLFGFFHLQVPVLHVIPTPFPDVWHTNADNIDAIDFATVTNLNKIFGIFCLEYLRIDVGPLHMEKK